MSAYPACRAVSSSRCQHPAEVDGYVAANAAALLVQGRCRGHDLVDASPAGAVGVDGARKGVAGLYRVVRDLDVLTGEAIRDPGDLRTRHVLHPPEQSGAALERRHACCVVVHASDLPNEGLPLVLQKRLQGLIVVSIEHGRLLVGHLGAS
jgi:hypothetical protein